MPGRRVAVVALLTLAGVAAVAVGASSLASGKPNAFTVRRLVADDRSLGTSIRDPLLVNPFGLAASPTGPWWTANEARDMSTLYSGSGAVQTLPVKVSGGPTGIVYNPTSGFPVRVGGRSEPARFIYACEDGKLRGWAPMLPKAWSQESEIAVDEGGRAAVFRGVALAAPPGAPARVYATDLHNGVVDVYDSHWRRVALPAGAFRDSRIPPWYGAYDVAVLAGRVFVTYAWGAPVNGNDSPHGGYVDEYDLDGHLLARVAASGPLNAPWGMTVAPKGFGPFGGDLLVGNFGDGHVNVFHESSGHRWRYEGSLKDTHGRPIAINGLWGLAFGNGAMAGARSTLYFTAGPHTWRGSSEQSVHGVLGTISAS
jgi:uncharacterized protein (TIGR03118 family)